MPALMDSDGMAGQRFGRDGMYVVGRRLGGGAYGEVFLARDEKRAMPVAIKFLREAGNDRVMIERFKREAVKYGLRVSHPNVVKVHCCGKERGRLFIVSEYVDGETLAQRLKSRGPLPVDEALRIAREIAEGLLAAHRADVVHRDLKPANVMIRSSDGAVKILDFGVAKDLMSSVGLTKGFVGTIGYAPPEQMKGIEIDHRVDIFALGAILYEMLTGEYAFRGHATREIIKATLHQDPIPPTELNENVTKPVAALIRKMIQRSPRRRPADMAEVIAEIDRIQGAVPPGVDDEARRGVRRWLRKLFEI